MKIIVQLRKISSRKNDNNLTKVKYVLTRFLCRKRTSTSSSGKSARRSNCSQQWDSRLASLDCTYMRALCFVHCTLLPVLCPDKLYIGLGPTQPSVCLSEKKGATSWRIHHHLLHLEENKKIKSQTFCAFYSQTDSGRNLRPSLGLKQIQSLW